MLKAAEYVGRIMPDGNLEVPTTVRQELELRPNMEVRVIVLRPEAVSNDKERHAQERAAVWRKVDALRAKFSGQDFCLTEALLQAREEEDAAL